MGTNIDGHGDGGVLLVTGVPDIFSTEILLNMSTGNGSEVEISRDTEACILFKFIMYTIAMGVLCILGFAGNTISFLVLRKDGSTPVASFLLEVLAIADNILLLLWIIHYSLREGFRYFELMDTIHDVWIYVRVYTFPVMYMAQTATIWLTVVIALNRYMAVCLPYRAPQLCNITNVYKGVAMVIFFSICYNVPRLFEIQIIYKDNTTSITWVRTALGANKIYEIVYVDVFYYIFSFVLPLATLAFVNTRVTIAYQKIRQRKRRMTSRRQENENNITLVMIIIVLIFMLCQAPARIVQLVWGYKYKHCETYQFYLIHISNTLEVLNSSVNCLVYFGFRKRFRDIALTHFFPCLKPKSHQSPERTTEGLSLVQIEQTQATDVLEEERRNSDSTKRNNCSQLADKPNGDCNTEQIENSLTLQEGEVANGVPEKCQETEEENTDVDHIDTPDAPLQP